MAPHPSEASTSPDPDAEAHQVFPASELRAVDAVISGANRPVAIRMGHGPQTWTSSPMPAWNADWMIGRLRKLYPDATVEVIE